MSDAILYLNDAAVEQFLPSPLEATLLVDKAMRAIARGEALLGHDMIRPVPTTGFSAIYGATRIGGDWIAAQKWVAETPQGVAATMFLNDGQDGRLRAILNARILTGLRTAAVSGACVAALGRPGPVAIVGTGLQARWHLRVLDAVGWHEARIVYRRQASADALREWAGQHVPRMRISFHADPREAVAATSIVITMVTRGAEGAAIPLDWIDPDALLLPVDFAHCITADVARAAGIIAADDPANYDHARHAGELPDYPDADCATGSLLGRDRPDGLILIQNLGNSAADMAIADHVERSARAVGAGILLDP